jgi:diketogulonate reductase-like aldo/keto reductase
MEESRQRLRVKQIDLMQIHNLRDWRRHLQTLEKWKSTGRIRYLGITTSHGRSHDQLLEALNSRAFDFVQFSYSIGNRTAEQQLFPLARDQGIATLVNRPFQRGRLFGIVRGKPLPDWAGEIDCRTWGQFFLKFVISRPEVTCVIPATSKPGHMVDNMGAGFGRLPDAATRQRMIDYLGSL